MISLGILTYNTAAVNSFSFQVVTTAPGETVTLPILVGGAGKIQNFTAYWGDTTSSVITAYNDPDRIHTYAVAGTYDIQLIGISQYFCYSSTTTVERNKVRKLLSFTGDMGFKNIDFYGCANLNTIVSLGTMASLIDADTLFQGCPLITSIPSGMFDGCPALLYLYNVFYGCTGLTSIPIDLFKYNTLVTRFDSAFTNCTGITSIPTDLFRYNTLVTTFTSVFQGCTGITSIPIDIFRYNTLVTGFASVFQNCSSITSIPTDLFRYNPSVTNFVSAFSGCSSLTSIPTDLFRYNTLVTTFASTFLSCSNLTSLPTGLFTYNTSVTTFISTFNACIILATIPIDLFRYNTLVTTFGSTFLNCRKAQYNINIFYAIGEEGTRFLNKSVVFTNCFNRSSFTGIQGVAPDLWNCDFGSGTPTKTNCYAGAGNSLVSLSNYASIPVDWKT